MSVDHRRTYVKAAAVHAASAIARLIGCREPKDVPLLRQLELAEPALHFVDFCRYAGEFHCHTTGGLVN